MQSKSVALCRSPSHFAHFSRLCFSMLLFLLLSFGNTTSVAAKRETEFFCPTPLIYVGKCKKAVVNFLRFFFFFETKKCECFLIFFSFCFRGCSGQRAVEGSPQKNRSVCLWQINVIID